MEENLDAEMSKFLKNLGLNHES